MGSYLQSSDHITNNNYHVKQNMKIFVDFWQIFLKNAIKNKVTLDEVTPLIGSYHKQQLSGGTKWFDLLTFDKNFLRTQIKCTGCWLRCVQDSHALLQSVSPSHFVFLCFLLVFYICIFSYLYFIIVPAALYSMQPRLVAFIGLSRTLLPRLYILKAKQIVLHKYYWKV